MSSLTKSLQKRIEELRLSIESQKAELAAYEKVFAVEVEREDVSADRQRIAGETDESNPEAPLELTGEQGAPRLPTSGRAATGNGEVQGSQAAGVPEFTGNKTEFVRAIVQARGSLGATPREIAEVFKARQIEKSKNFIYNALVALVKQNKFKRESGRYFPPSRDAQGKGKSRISPAGLKRIREANKKRWAKERAAQALTGHCQVERKYAHRLKVADSQVSFLDRKNRPPDQSHPRGPFPQTPDFAST